ncbi:MAG: FAD-dependent oxidoreductase [Bacteroidia bacterium]
MNYLLFPRIVILCMIMYSCSPTSVRTEVLVVGGGASGTPAAIQVARLGADVILVEETPWLGGMMTAAGVSATDGNHRLPSGLWGEFRQKLYDYYGGPDSVFTGWVSNTLFEPHIGNQFWNEMANEEPGLKRIHGFRPVDVIKLGHQVKGAIFENSEGEKLKIEARVVIEATELGDVLGLTGAEFFTGQDTPENPHDNHIQDLTYTAIFKDYGPEADMSIPEPPDYDAREFECICKQVCDDPERNVPDCSFFLNYGELPNGKYMMNWPNNGNDYFTNPVPMSFSEREKVYQAAKNRTLGLLYFLQKEAGYIHLGLADDEFPTKDQMPFMPYHREARRGKGLVQLKVEDLIDPYNDPQRAFYREAIAVGDYPLDHHHGKNPQAREESFPSIPSFSIPFRALIPEKTDGLILAEKSISVTHLVNGASRLQPCVILIGQAAGAAAALSVQLNVQARNLPVEKVQQVLLDANCWLLPFIDTNPGEWAFESLQKAGLKGLIKGHGIPYKWANQTWIYPDTTMKVSEYADILEQVQANSSMLLLSAVEDNPDQLVSGKLLFESVAEISGIEITDSVNFMNEFESRGWLEPLEMKHLQTNLSEAAAKKEIIWLLDQAFDFWKK